MPTTKKTVDAAAEVVTATVPEAVTPDPEERVEIYVPRSNGDPNLYVSVNDYAALLPKGQKSMVPRYVADAILDAWAADDKYQDMAAELAASMKPAQ